MCLLFVYLLVCSHRNGTTSVEGDGLPEMAQIAPTFNVKCRYLVFITNYGGARPKCYGARQNLE